MDNTNNTNNSNNKEIDLNANSKDGISPGKIITNTNENKEDLYDF